MKKRLLIVKADQFGYSAAHKYYCELLRDYYNIDYICFDKGFEKLEATGINVKYLPYNVNKLYRLFTFIYYSIKMTYKNKYDAILIVYHKFSIITGLLAKCKNKIIDIRTGDLSHNKIKRYIKNYIIRINSLTYPKKIVISESLRELIKLNKRNTEVIPLGASSIGKSKASFEEFRLLYVGILNNRRIIDTLEGFKKFNDKYSSDINIHYDIIGYGTDENEILEYIKKNNMIGIIDYHGQKNHKQLSVFFANSNIGVAYVPVTDYYDVQPSTKIYEYALSGIFTIATNTYENKKIVNSKNGILCEDNSESFFHALEKLIKIRYKINKEEIIQSLIDYQWGKIVSNKLIPFIEK